MRKCGECTLCCKIPRITGFKPPNEWCKYVGKGCTIYDIRPGACRAFECRWLADIEMGDEYRPDKVHFYVDRGDEEVLKVRVDTDYPDAWRGNPIVEAFLDQGKHVIVSVGDQVTFLGGRGRPRPEKLLLEWTL